MEQHTVGKPSIAHQLTTAGLPLKTRLPLGTEIETITNGSVVWVTSYSYLEKPIAYVDGDGPLPVLVLPSSDTTTNYQLFNRGTSYHHGPWQVIYHGYAIADRLRRVAFRGQAINGWGQPDGVSTITDIAILRTSESALNEDLVYTESEIHPHGTLANLQALYRP